MPCDETRHSKTCVLASQNPADSSFCYVCVPPPSPPLPPPQVGVLDDVSELHQAPDDLVMLDKIDEPSILQVRIVEEISGKYMEEMRH